MRLKLSHIRVMTLLSIFFVASCTYREINFEFYQSADILLRADWSGFVEEEPTGMSVYCYSADEPSKAPYLYLSNNVDSVKLSLPQGRYNILVFNQSVDEFGSMHFSGMNKFETASAQLEELVPKWKAKSDGEQIVYDPEWLAVDVIRDFEVTYKMVEETARYRHGESKDPYAARIDVSPVTVVKTVDVRVRLYGINYARSARGSVTGLATQYLLGLGKCGTGSGTHILENWEAIYDVNEKLSGYVSTEYRSFGLPEDITKRSDESSRLFLTFLLIDNKTICDTGFSVGNQFVPGTSPGTLLLWTGYQSDEGQAPSLYCDCAKPVELPHTEPEHGGDAGFDPTIGDWDDSTDVNVDIK